MIDKLQHPDKLLLQKARDFGHPVGMIKLRDGFDHPDFRHLFPLLPELSELMKERRLVGIALPQVGWPVRAILYDPWCMHYPRVFLNPSWDASRTVLAQVESPEGCLSVHDCQTKIPVKRWDFIKAQGLELTFKRGKPRLDPYRSELQGWEARVWQHECDHLDGVLLGGSKIPEKAGTWHSTPGADE